MGTLIELVGFMVIWASTDVGRSGDSKTKIFSKNWWIIGLLIFVGVTLINIANQYE